MNTFSGNYPIEHRAGEIERLRVQSKAVEPDAVAMLERFGSMAGWVCLDIGCGPGGITDLLSTRVGPAGLVIGLDMNAQFLEHSRHNAPKNVEFLVGDAYRSDLPAGKFDLVHMRFVASTTEHPEQLLKEATRLVRPGGLIALQEPDLPTWRHSRRSAPISNWRGSSTFWSIRPAFAMSNTGPRCLGFARLIL
jgi:ubiquinone/menaquinone biosynthesis C-methylase UbiE